MNKNSQTDQLDKLLGTLFYRRSCPETEQLGEYHMNLLAPGQRLVVAQHMRICPHCTSELARYETPEKEARSWLSQLGDRITQVRWAKEIAVPQLVSRDRTVSHARRRYKFAGGEVDLDIIRSNAGYQRWELVGAIMADRPMGRVVMWDEQCAEIESDPVDQKDGFFQFKQLKTGIYYLYLSNPPVEIWLGKIAIGEIDTS